jgi:hypothetical protein
MMRGLVALLALALLLLGLAAPSQGTAVSAQSSGALRAESEMEKKKKNPASTPPCCVCGSPCISTGGCNWQTPTSSCGCAPEHFSRTAC